MREKDVNLVLQLGLSPLAEAPDVPMILDKAKTQTDRKAMELVATLNTVGRPFFGPPRMTAQATAMWRSAFAELVRNEAFLAQMERQKLDVSFLDGESLQQTVQQMMDTTPEIAEAARNSLEPNATEVKTFSK